MKQSYIYILANKPYGTLYIGVTSDLIKRVYQHKHKLIDGFTSRYDINTLVYYEVFEEIEYAIKREKQLKNWHRDWKINLINSTNKKWLDLYDTIVG